MSTRKVLLVTGGNGYVGSHVCKAALARGWTVKSLNRSGAPALSTEKYPWINQVEWVSGSALEPSEWKEDLKVDAVVACVGGFGNQEQMERICGDTNIEVAKAAREEGVRRYVFISAAVYPGVDKVLTGYYRGKARVEQELKENWSSDGDSDSKEENKVGWSALRPGFVYGTRLVNGVPVPLGLIGKPMSFFLSLPVINQLQKLPVLGNLFLPPVDVEDVALTAVLAAEGKPGTDGILYTEDIVTLPKTLAGDE